MKQPKEPPNQSTCLTCSTLFLEIVGLKEGKPSFISHDLAMKTIQSFIDVSNAKECVLHITGDGAQCEHPKLIYYINRALRLGYRVFVDCGNSKIGDISAQITKARKDEIDLSNVCFLAKDKISEMTVFMTGIQIQYKADGILGSLKGKALGYSVYTPRKRVVCPYVSDSVTVRYDGGMYICPINQNEDVKYKASETWDVTMIQTYVSDMQLRQRLIQGKPQDSCRKHCKWANTNNE